LLRGQLVKLGVVNEYHEYRDGHILNYTDTAVAMYKYIAFLKGSKEACISNLEYLIKV